MVGRNITPEEKRWLKMLSEGNSTDDVAKAVKIPKGTLVYKLGRLRDRLGCSNMAHLVAHSIRNNIIK
jgi:DNA-binding CsgD family transcriptional regulator